MFKKKSIINRSKQVNSVDSLTTDSTSQTAQTINLSNGSSLSLYEKASPDISLVVGIPYGLSDDRHKAHLLEHMVFRSRTDKGQDPGLIFEKLEGHFMGVTNRDVMYLTLRVPKQHYSLAMEMLSEILNDTRIPRKKLEIAKEVVCGECIKEKSLTNHVTERQQERDLFRGHQLWLPNETLRQTREITIDELVEAKEKYFGAKNLCLGIVGENVKKLKPKALELLIGLRHSGNKKPRFQIPQIERNSTRLHLLSVGAEQHIAIIVPGYGNPDYAAVEMIAQKIGGLNPDYYLRSELFKNLREKRGLLYGPDASIQAYNGIAILNFDADGILSKNEDEVRKMMLEEIAKSADRPMREEEFEAVKSSLLNSNRRQQCDESGLETAERLVNTSMYDSDLSFENYKKEIEKLTPQKVYRVAQKYIAPGKFSIISVTTKNKFS